MNDFERKLSQQPFRAPPSDLREAILGPAAAKIVTAGHPTWRDWFWPSPQAWVALAALWLLFAAVQFSDRPASAFPAAPAVSASTTSAGGAPAPLLTFHRARDFRHVLEFPN